MSSKKAVSKTDRRSPGKGPIRKLAGSRPAGTTPKRKPGVIYRPLAAVDDGPTTADIKSRALKSAIALRDCSFNPANSSPVNKSCRKVMRQQAKKWRDGGVNAPEME
jgi:hypothetical protein